MEDQITQIKDQGNQLFDTGLLPESKKCYKQLHKMGIIDGHIFYRLGLFYLPGRYLLKKIPDPDKSNRFFQLALQLLPQKADLGDPEAMGDLAYMYDMGLGLPSNMSKAVDYYKSAANGGLARAQFNLGYMYAEGDGVPVSKELSLVYYKLAADQQDVEAAYNVGTLSKEKGDYETAFRYFMSSALEWNRSHKECTQIFKGKEGPQLQHIANTYISTNWPKSHTMIEEGCKEAIKAIILASKMVSGDDFICLPIELSLLVAKSLILVWPKVHHFEPLNFMKKK